MVNYIKMTERVVTLLKKGTKKISCFFDGKIFENLSSDQIAKIIGEIKTVGSIRSAKVFFDQKLSGEQHKSFIHLGLSPVIVPSDVDLYMALDILDTLHSGEKDVIAIGVNDTQLLPVIITARDKIEIMLVSGDEKSIESLSQYSDYLLKVI